jgi:hypothetical protein
VNDFEDRLAGFRPSGPPPDLRARILLAADDSRPARWRDWVPALAAAALLVLFFVLSDRVHADIDARLFVPDEARPVEQWLPEPVQGLP